jgi:hypothetical protein
VDRLKHLCCVSPKLLAWQEQLQSFLFPAYRSISLSRARARARSLSRTISRSHALFLCIYISLARARVLSLSRSPSLALSHTFATMYTHAGDMRGIRYIVAKQAM